MAASLQTPSNSLVLCHSAVLWYLNHWQGCNRPPPPTPIAAARLLQGPSRFYVIRKKTKVVRQVNVNGIHTQHSTVCIKIDKNYAVILSTNKGTA